MIMITVHIMKAIVKTIIIGTLVQHFYYYYYVIMYFINTKYPFGMFTL